MYSVHTGIHSLEYIVEAVLTGTHYDLNELKPIYAAYNSIDLDKGRSSWKLKEAIGKRLLQEGGSNEEIIEEEEDKQAVGKWQGPSSTGTEQDITKEQKVGLFGWTVANQ